MITKDEIKEKLERVIKSPYGWTELYVDAYDNTWDNPHDAEAYNEISKSVKSRDLLVLESNYLGDFRYLDPCGKYHNVLSQNGIPSKCAKFWKNLSDCAEEFGYWVEFGEGNATDVFLMREKKGVYCDNKR